MMHRLLYPATVLVLAACGSSSSPTSLTTPTTPTTPTSPIAETVLVTGSVPASGGTLTYTKAGDPLSGLTLAVPNGAYASAATISIGSTSGAKPTLPAGYAQVGKTLVLSNSLGFAAAPMILTIPISVRSNDSAVAAFLYDSASGRMELIPPADRDSVSYSVFTNHFTASQMFPTSGTGSVSGRPVSGSAATVASGGFAPISVVIVTTQATTLATPATTGFLPGRDDWEFVNFGTAVGPDGICAGMSISAMYYYYSLKSAGALNRKFNLAGSNTDANPMGLRLSSVVQVAQDNNFSRSTAKYSQVKSLGAAVHVPPQPLFYRAIVMALQVTRLPQYLALDGLEADGTALGHAVVAYASGNNVISFADPNAPGTQRSMQFDPLGFLTPFAFSANAAAASGTVNFVWSFGVSTLVDRTQLAAQWQSAMTDTTFERTSYPTMIAERLDTALTDTWIVIDSTRPTLVTAATPFILRTRCTETRCPRTLVTPQVAGQQATSLIDASGNELAPIGYSDRIVLPKGTTKVGVVQKVAIDAAGHVTWANFHWLNVDFAPAALTPQASPEPAGSSVTLSVTRSDLTPLATSFVWDFGDGTAAVTTTTSTTTHTYTLPGTYKVTVKLLDASGTVIGEDNTSYAIKPASTIQFTLAGSWPTYYPPDGSYTFKDGIGGRGNNAAPGLDLIEFGYDFQPDSAGTYNNAVLVNLVVASGTQLTSGQVFTQVALGAPAAANTFTVVLDSSLTVPNGFLVGKPDGIAGTLTVTDVALQSDSSDVANYTFSISNAAGGTLVGKGMGQWKGAYNYATGAFTRAKRSAGFAGVTR